MSSPGPLIVQSDHTLLLEVDHPGYLDARDDLLPFAELVKSPEHVHTYRITPLSVWNARAAGVTTHQMVEALEWHAKFPPPANVLRELKEQASRYGKLQIRKSREHTEDDRLVLVCESPELADRLAVTKGLDKYLVDRQPGEARFFLEPGIRGQIKQALVRNGYPAEDLAGFTPGKPLPVSLRAATVQRPDRSFTLRAYQQEAVDAFFAGAPTEADQEADAEATAAVVRNGADASGPGGVGGGSGVIVLPCGAGKTVIGIASLARASVSTLILAPSTSAVRQWIAELLDKTDLTAEDIGEYSGTSKEIRPVTVATYQVLTHSKAAKQGGTTRDDAPELEADPVEGSGGLEHLKLFDREDWGLIIYDEVHLLPAPIFSATATIQSRRRLGLTATLVREDGREEDVFALIGPKRCDVPWKVLEGQGWIAKARCVEVRVPMPEDLMSRYYASPKRSMFRVASENPDKAEQVKRILALHPGEPALVIGMYVDQLKALARELDAPLIVGTTGQRKRDELYQQFREGELPVLVVSKVANFAIDLPDASLAIQVSGTFGSRQEEAQRLGRILRPKSGSADGDGGQAYFYSLVSRDTTEQEFAMNRQLFLCEQGYAYELVDAEQDDAVLLGRADP